MKIAVISDTHDNLSNLIKALTLINQEKVSALIHCGDVCSIDTFDIITKNFNKKIFLVFGNCDIKNGWNKYAKNKKIKIFNEVGTLKLNKKNIKIVHNPKLIDKILKNRKDDLDFIFYGHIHKPWIEKMNKTIVLNPGNICGVFYKSTFAICDLEKMTQKLVII